MSCDFGCLLISIHFPDFSSCDAGSKPSKPALRGRFKLSMPMQTSFCHSKKEYCVYNRPVDEFTDDNRMMYSSHICIILDCVISTIYIFRDYLWWWYMIVMLLTFSFLTCKTWHCWLEQVAASQHHSPHSDVHAVMTAADTPICPKSVISLDTKSAESEVRQPRITENSWKFAW